MPPELAFALGCADWSLVGWLALLAGCLALDDTALAQTWLSQPLPAAILAGLVCGEPMAGLALGLPLQLALTMNLPVGQTVTGDAAGAVVAGVGGTVLAGRLPAPLAGGVGDPALTGWLLLGAAIISLSGHPLIQAERRLHLVWMLQGRQTLRDGRLGRIDRIQGWCVLATFLRGTLFGAAATLAVAGLWIPAYDALPAVLSPALAWLPWLAGALGIGAVFERYGLSPHWRWVTAGAAVGWLLGVVA
jgi:mannose/fructose/N-acetylgalactosamine-specific phosphotransferase system component IIC